jgi:oxygen-dependent protoporphyrinogen oxidase
LNNVVIVGGGIAGLATAYELSRRGVPFVLLESADRAGGVILSEQIDGFTIDAGPDSLLVQKRDGITLCEELGLGDRLVPTKPPRLAFILRNGTLHPLPAASVLGVPTRLGPFASSTLFTVAGKARMAAELLIPRRDPPDVDESIGAFIARRFGREARTYLAEPLLAGIHAGDVDRLSMKALFPRFIEAERASGSLIRAFRAERRSPSDQGAFRSLPGGLSDMTAALVAALPARSIRLRTDASQLTWRRDEAAPGTAGQFRIQTAGGETLAASAVVIATPAYVTARLLRDVDPALARLCDEIRYTSTATIVLAFPRGAVAHPLNGTGFVVPNAEGLGMLAASWLSSKWPNRAPEDSVLMRAFAGGARDPDALGRSDAQLAAHSISVLRPLLGITGDPLLTRVYRWPRSSAQHEVGHLARMEAIERSLAAHPGLFLTGSGFRGVGIPDCVADGRRTAALAADWLAARGSASAAAASERAQAAR